MLPRQPISVLCPPLSLSHLLALALFGCSRRGRGDGKRGGKWRQRGREGGEARRGASLHSERVKELENKYRERESLLSVWLSRREVRIHHTRSVRPPASTLSKEGKTRRQRKGQERSVWLDYQTVTVRDTRRDRTMPLWRDAAVGCQAASPV